MAFCNNYKYNNLNSKIRNMQHMEVITIYHYITKGFALFHYHYKINLQDM